MQTRTISFRESDHVGTAYLEAAGNHQLQVAKLCCEGVRCNQVPLNDKRLYNSAYR